MKQKEINIMITKIGEHVRKLSVPEGTSIQKAIDMVYTSIGYNVYVRNELITDLSVNVNEADIIILKRIEYTNNITLTESDLRNLMKGDFVIINDVQIALSDIGYNVMLDCLKDAVHDSLGGHELWQDLINQ